MKKSIDVFDFNEEDEELAESASGKLLEKFANPSSSVSPILQCQRIQSFCQEEPAPKEVEGASCAEAATDVVDRHCEDAPALATEAEESSRDHFTESDVNHGLVFGLNTEDRGKEADVEDDHHRLLFGLNTEDRAKEADVDDDDHGLMFGFDTEDHMKETDEDHGLESFSCQPSAKSFYAETSSYSQPQLNSPFSDSSSSPERTDMMSAIDESLSDRSALSEASDSEDWMAEHCFDDMEKIDRNTAVIMIPEYVVLKDMPCAASLVIFSCNGIKIKSYPDNNGEGPFCCEFGVEDIVSIQYNWYQNVGLIILRIRVLLKDEKCHEDLQHTTDIEELKFAVKDHNWPEKQQQINSLHVKYPAVWSADLDEDVEVSGDNLHRRKRYFPRFDEPFEDVVYPKGDPDAVSVCKRDVELLQPETFVNDTIIDFYINYLKNQIQAEERQRFHFFNSFFFRKLADLDKDPSSIADGRAAFLRVRKWTRKVDMFGKDYIFVPVNFSLHWSLIIICHPGEVANGTDLDSDDSPKVPCILHMDSIKGSHAGLKNLVQSYLCEEWKERHKETSDDISSRFMNLRFVSLELPQQENSFDCGLFLLHYLELFLAEAPQNFSPFKIYNASNFLYLNWFPPAEASLKRTLIEKLIFELLENRSREVINEQDQSCESPVPVNNNTGIEVLSGRCTPLIDCNGNMTQTQDEQGIEMTLLERSSMRNLQAVNDSGMVLRDLFDAGANNTGSLLGQLQQTFDEPSSFYHLSNNSLATEQVEMESGEQFMCLNSGEGGNFQRITGTASPRASASFSSLNLSMMPVQKEGVADSLSNDSEDIGIIEDIPMENINEGETGESPSRETVSLFSATLGPITDHNTENEDLPSTPDELVVASSQDGRDEEKQLENDLGIGDKTNEDLEVKDRTRDDLGTEDKTGGDLGTEDKTGGDLGTEDKTGGDLGTEDKTNEAPGIGGKTNEALGIEDKTRDDLGTEDKTSGDLRTKDKRNEDLGIEEEKTNEDLKTEEKTSDAFGIEEKKSEDLGDDCDQKEKELTEDEEEKRAAKRPRLSSTGEAEEMEIN
ncbi:probable ubiquitin-like-specific protease 2B isoform X2 [Brassica napus]|uniref:probable ubiquitin-like-specific protease 2B isoform X2 n=1 Tax=Brassica napus TaxID=3708 RepID=UPI0020790D4A|nr:probable ubiquitin-like-specific protease 2B isoform X2 [Brassica napus]